MFWRLAKCKDCTKELFFGSRQMKTDLCYLHIFVHNAKFNSLVSFDDFSAAVEITITNNKEIQSNQDFRFHRKPTIINRRTSDILINSPDFFEWEEQVDIRCCEGWDVYVSLVLKNKNAKEHVLEMKLLSAMTYERSFYSLYTSNNKEVGFMELTFELFPNNQSFKNMLNDFMMNPNIFELLLDELISMLKNENLFHIDEKELFILNITKFQPFLIPKNISTILLSILNSSLVTNINTLNEKTQLEMSIEIFKVVTITKSFFLSLSLELIYGMNWTLGLIEKMISIFVTNCPESTVVTANGEKMMAWEHFCLFVKLCGVWTVHHAFVLCSLKNEYHMCAEEIIAIRDRFAPYDQHLSGEMSAADLSAFLIDLKGEYTPQQVQYIRLQLDGDELDCVEFSYFIRWWTSAFDSYDDPALPGLDGERGVVAQQTAEQQDGMVPRKQATRTR